MATFRLSVAVAHSLPAPTALGRAAFPNLAAAVAELTQAAHGKWVDYAMGATLPDGRSIKNSTGAYARSIMVRQTGDFAGEVFSELPYARALETGTPARDLKDMLGSSLKVRVTKGGKRYLIIPFRSYGPNSVIGAPMPKAIHDWWKGVPQGSNSHVTKLTYRQSGTGALDIKTRKPLLVRARKYKWGTKLSAQAIRGMGLGEAAVKRFAGMYRMGHPAKPGRQTQMLTFRTMMEGSPGWKVQARPGYYPARTVAEQLQPRAEKAFAEAMERDVRRMLGQG